MSASFLALLSLGIQQHPLAAAQQNAVRTETQEEGSSERESYIQKKKGERKGRSFRDAGRGGGGGGGGGDGKLSSTGQAGKQRITQGDTQGAHSPLGSLVCVPSNLG